MFLTPEELKTLTGYELAAWQRRWLDSHGYKYERAANGRPVVLRAYAESRLSGTVQEQGWKPNLEAIRKVA
jgi:hypothetical protein